MAEKKGGGGGILTSIDDFELVIAILFFAALLGAVFAKISSILGASLWEIIWFHIKNVVLLLLPIIKVLSAILSGAIVMGIIYVIVKINRMSADQKKILYPEEAKPKEAEIVNKKWQKVLQHIDSENASDWKLAILEADIILDEMLEKMGYRGETMGDRLKSVEKSDFLSIDMAWEAHKVRNSIAHEGSEFAITQREARRIVDLYKQVFEEFKYI